MGQDGNPLTLTTQTRRPNAAASPFCDKYTFLLEVFSVYVFCGLFVLDISCGCNHFLIMFEMLSLPWPVCLRLLSATTLPLPLCLPRRALRSSSSSSSPSSSQPFLQLVQGNVAGPTSSGRLCHRICRTDGLRNNAGPAASGQRFCPHP